MFKENLKNRMNQVMYDSRMHFECFCMDMQTWWRNNKDWAIVVIPAGVAIGSKVINSTAKVLSARQNAKAAEITARTVWDPNLQIHHTLKRPMNSIETQDYIRMINSGMKMNEALQALRLI